MSALFARRLGAPAVRSLGARAVRKLSAPLAVRRLGALVRRLGARAARKLKAPAVRRLSAPPAVRRLVIARDGVGEIVVIINDDKFIFISVCC